MPAQRDIDRFERYCRRVRSLRFSELYKPRHAVLELIARIRPPSILLPNLRTLEWSPFANQNIAEYSVMFMHQNIREFILSPPDSRSSNDNIVALTSYFEIVKLRMPHLSHLELRMNPSPGLKDALMQLIDSMPALQSLVFPAFPEAEVSSIMARLSSAPNIQKITVRNFGPSEEHIYDFHDDDADVDSISHGCFQALYHLDLPVYPDFVIPMLSMGFATLSVLRLTPFYSVTSDEIERLTTALSNSSPLLREFRLRYSQKETGIVEAPDVDDGVIIYRTISSLTACVGLTVFEIAHTFPSAIALSDIDSLAAAWPLLETFCLTSSPYSSEGGIYLPLSAALLSFARHCPNITNLGLFMQGDVTGMPQDLQGALALPHRLSRLRDLTVGESSVQDDVVPIAIFLSKILPPTCRVLPAMIPSPMIPDNLRGAKWRKIDGMLAPLAVFRTEVSTRIDGLVRRVEELEKSNTALQDRLADLV